MLVLIAAIALTFRGVCYETDLIDCGSLSDREGLPNAKNLGLAAWAAKVACTTHRVGGAGLGTTFAGRASDAGKCQGAC